MVNIDPLNFTREVRGRKAVSSNGIPEELTVVDVAGKVAEFFKPYSWFIPIVTGWILDVRTGLTWDNKLWDKRFLIWVSHIATMEEISVVKFKRANVPHNAKSLWTL